MNIFEIEKIPVNEEIVEILKENDNIKIEKIISSGQTTDWMIQDKEEYVILLQGNAEIEYENNKKIKLKSGDSVIIKKEEKHRVSYTSVDPYCIWLCIFY